MRITDADVWQMATEVNHQSRNRYGGTTRLERALVRLCDEEGHEGWGEAMPVSFTDEAISDAVGAIKAAAATLKGREMEDPLAEIGSLADFSGQGMRAICGYRQEVNAIQYQLLRRRILPGAL